MIKFLIRRIDYFNYYIRKVVIKIALIFSDWGKSTVGEKEGVEVVCL